MVIMKEKINKYTFNVIAYSNTFTWLDNEEKKHMAGVLWQAWVKLRPKKEDRHDEFDIVHEAAGRINSYLYTKCERKNGTAKRKYRK